MTTKFSLVATGGTFDYIHIGHIRLLSKAFSYGDRVIIGLTSDDFIKKYKISCDVKYSFRDRYLNLIQILSENFSNKKYEVVKLDDEFGPVTSSSKIQAIVVSEETLNKIHKINRIRSGKNLKSLEVIVVKLARSDDGNIISSTRIRRGEIDKNGKILIKKIKEN